MYVLLFQAARPIKSKKANKRTSRQMNRQTKANYIYKLQLTTTHNAKFSKNMTKKQKLKNLKKNPEILKKTKSYVAHIQYKNTH